MTLYRKFSTAALTSIFALGLVACGDDSSSSSADAKSDSKSAAKCRIP